MHSQNGTVARLFPITSDIKITTLSRFDNMLLFDTSSKYVKSKVVLCLTNQALRHEGVWGGGYLQKKICACAKCLKMTIDLQLFQNSSVSLSFQGMNHRQFKDFVTDTEFGYGDIVYCMKIRWLSLGQMSRCVYDLESEVELFLILTRQLFLSFMIMIGYANLIFALITTNEQSIILHRGNHLVHKMVDKITFRRIIWEMQLHSHSTLLNAENGKAH
jgi:hypothetical protein